MNDELWVLPYGPGRRVAHLAWPCRTIPFPEFACGAPDPVHHRLRIRLLPHLRQAVRKLIIMVALHYRDDRLIFNGLFCAGALGGCRPASSRARARRRLGEPPGKKWRHCGVRP